MKAREDYLPWDELDSELSELCEALEKNDVYNMRSILERLVSGYQPTSEVVDWMHLELESISDNPSLRIRCDSAG
ncbi:hypothetical protein D9M68_899630 [compost metagenome]